MTVPALDFDRVGIDDLAVGLRLLGAGQRGRLRNFVRKHRAAVEVLAPSAAGVLKDDDAIHRLMDRHKAVIAPKFQKVLDIFEEKLAQVPDVSWTRPKGGYFISLEVGKGCAKRVVALAKEALGGPARASGRSSSRWVFVCCPTPRAVIP